MPLAGVSSPTSVLAARLSPVGVARTSVDTGASTGAPSEATGEKGTVEEVGTSAKLRFTPCEAIDFAMELKSVTNFEVYLSRRG